MDERKPCSKPDKPFTAGSVRQGLQGYFGYVNVRAMGKIFAPYFTTKGPQEGTGVGLFMSKTIIEKNMGGKLTGRNTANGAELRIEV